MTTTTTAADVKDNTIAFPTRQRPKSLMLKRSVVVKTLVTDSFKQQANRELSKELQTIDSQLEQLEAQYQHTLRQLEGMAQNGQHVAPQLQQLNQEAQQRRTQLSTLKMEVSSQLANLDKVPNGTYIVTGNLENYVELGVGDNIYDRIRNAEIRVTDGVVTDIID
ncbi:MAG: YlqD family protein [Candidatus Melainabacteria bacterium]|nr:YlqD family protein [Candidatus Melainabacteria bacterium]